MWNSEYGIRNSEFGIQNSELRIRIEVKKMNHLGHRSVCETVAKKASVQVRIHTTLLVVVSLVAGTIVVSFRKTPLRPLDQR